MASVDKNEIRKNLENTLTEEMRSFAEEMVRESNQEITKELRTSIDRYSEKQAKKLAKAIVDGMSPLFAAINDNANRINSLQLNSNTTTG